jgi:hypothetical protein
MLHAIPFAAINPNSLASANLAGPMYSNPAVSRVVAAVLYGSYLNNARETTRASCPFAS